MSKLTVVCLKDTGHVLAALTRADPPQGEDQAGALVGAGLPVRFIEQQPGITVPAQYLAAFPVDDQPKVLASPQDFWVVQDPKGQAPPQVKNAGVAGSSVLFAIDATSGITATVTNVPSATTLPAVVVLQSAKSPSPPPTILPVVTVTVGVPTAVSDMTGFVKNDEWNVYGFVQSLTPVFQSVKVTEPVTGT